MPLRCGKGRRCVRVAARVVRPRVPAAPRRTRASKTAHPKKVPRTLYTIGHSTRPVEELVDLLRTFGVTRLVDIRSIPRSRTNPQFNLDVLPAMLAKAKIAYVHLASLGGRRAKSKEVGTDANAGWQKPPFHNYADYAETTPFREGLSTLLEMASRETCAIMCAEAVWWRCHRRIVADHALAHGVPVVHLFTRQKSEPASLTPFAVVGAGARVSYPASPVDPHGTDVAPHEPMARASKKRRTAPTKLRSRT